MAQSKIFKVSALPDVFEANAVYYVASGVGLVELYVASSDGLSVRQLDQTEAIMARFMAFGPTAPDIGTTDYLLWWNTTKGTLYVRYTEEGGVAQWVEAAPANDFPAFAGNGDADTMSRSNHWHDSLKIETEW